MHSLFQVRASKKRRVTIRSAILNCRARFQSLFHGLIIIFNQSNSVSESVAVILTMLL